MPAGTLDDKYLNWIYGQVCDAERRKSTETYWRLFGQMHATEFTYFVPNDEDRAADGKDLRQEWVLEGNIELDDEWLELECSFLELLVGLAKRLDFQTEEPPEYWFWKLLENLNLLDRVDSSDWDARDVEEIMYCVMNRTYNRDGSGGLFPLRKTRKNQTRVDIWYQMSEYILQNM